MKLGAWGILLLAGALEILWAVGIRYTEEWKRPLPSAVVVISYIACLPLLAIAMRHLPSATAYAAWVGIGTVGVALWGILFFGESAAPIRLLCIFLILVGVIGLKLAN